MHGADGAAEADSAEVVAAGAGLAGEVLVVVDMAVGDSVVGMAAVDMAVGKWPRDPPLDPRPGQPRPSTAAPR